MCVCLRHLAFRVCVSVFYPFKSFPLFCFLLLSLYNLVISWILCCVFLEGRGSLRRAARSGRLATNRRQVVVATLV